MLDNFQHFFVLTVADLRNRIKKDSEYDIIRACGLCRQLILDDNHALLDLANDRFNLQVYFQTSKPKQLYIFGEPISATIEWHNISPRQNDSRSIGVKRFKHSIALKYKGKDINVEQIIKGASQFMGGVHSRLPHPKNKNEMALQALYESSAHMKDNMAIKALKEICVIVLKAVEPLESKILGHTSADGF